jgi:hypothetical protein
MKEEREKKKKKRPRRFNDCSRQETLSSLHYRFHFETGKFQILAEKGEM